eukprot:g13246.t1
MGRRRKGKGKKPVDEDEEEEEEVVEEQEAPPKKKKVVIQEALPPTKKKKAPEEDWNAEVRAKFQAGPPDGEELFTFEEYDSWAVSSYYSEELSTEEKAKRRNLSMFVKYHIIPKVVGPVDTASPFLGWTLFAGPDDDPDDEDFYQDEAWRTSGTRPVRTCWHNCSPSPWTSTQNVREAARPPKPAARASKGLVSHVSGRDEAQASIKCRRAASAPGAGRRRGGGGSTSHANPQKYQRCAFLLDVCLPTPQMLEAVERSGGALGASPSDPAMNMAEFPGPLMGQDFSTTSSVASAARSPQKIFWRQQQVWDHGCDAEPPLDPAWDREWKVEPVQQSDHLWYYGTVTTAPDKDDGLVALYCVVLAAPEQKYRSGKGKYKVPWFQVVVEVMEMRVSKEIPTDFQVCGVTPKPKVARAWDGSKKSRSQPQAGCGQS